MISFNMKISIFLLFTILTVLQAEFQYGNKYSRYEIGNSDENNHETHLSSKINLEPEYNDDDEDTHFHTKVKVVCCHGQTVCPKKLKKRMNYSDRAEVNRRNRTSRSSKKAGRGKRSSRRMNNKMKKEYEEDRELVQAKEVSEFESEMNNSRFGKEYSLLAKGGHGEYQSTTYNGAKHKEFAENISGKLNRAYVNQKSEREIYSNKRLGKSNQKVLNEDFDDDTLGTIIGPESASTSLNGEDGNGVNSGDKEYGNNKNVLNEDFDDDALGAIIGPESASTSLNGEDGNGVNSGDKEYGNNKNVLNEDFDDDTLGTIIGPESASTSLNGEDGNGVNSGDKEYGNNKNVLNEDFDDDALGTIIGPESASTSLNGEDGNGVNSGDKEYGNNKNVLNEDFDDDTLGTIIGPESASTSLNGEDGNGVNSGDKEYGNNKNVLNEDFDDDTLGTIIGPESASTSLNGEDDNGVNSGDEEYGNNKNVLNEDFDDDTLGTIIGPESASPSLYGKRDGHCPYKSCPCGGCKKCGGCTILGCKCNDFKGLQEGRDFGGSKGNSLKAVRNNSYSKTSETSIGTERESPSLYSEADKRSASGCPYKKCPCGGCKECGGCTILGCKCNDFKGLQEGRDFDGSKGNSLNAVRNNYYSKTSGTSIGPERDSSSLYNEADKRSASGCPYKKCPCGGCKKCGGCTILGCKCNSFNGMQEGRGFGGSEGNSLKAVRNNSYSKTSGTSIGPERDSSSLYSEADKRSASGCPYKKCPCGGCKKCGGCTILGCKCNGFNGMQEGRGFSRSKGNSLKAVRDNSYSKTSGTSIGPERESSSLYSEADKRSASGCPYKKCPCGGCKKCGGCTILGCKCNDFKGLQEGRDFDGSKGNSLNAVRNNSYSKTSGTSIGPERDSSSLYSEADKRSASGCPYKKCPCGGCKKCGGCTILGCKCNGFNGMQEGRGFGGSVGDNQQFVRKSVAVKKPVTTSRPFGWHLYR